MLYMNFDIHGSLSASKPKSKNFINCSLPSLKCGGCIGFLFFPLFSSIDSASKLVIFQLLITDQAVQASCDVLT